MAPFSQSFSPPLSPDGMNVDVTSQSTSHLVSPLQDPFFYANIIQRTEKTSEFRKTRPSSPMDDEQDSNKINHNNDDDENHASYEVASCEDDEEYNIPSPPKRRTSRNNFAAVIQRLSSVTKPTVPSKKSVRFQDDSKNLLRLIREIESHKDYSTRERNRCWWSPSEKERCMSKHERVVSRMEHQKPCRRNETYRGLESWTTQGAAKLDQVINICVDAVMDEQDYQWKVHKDDFNRIAAISQRVTADSAKRARLVGMRDEREALLVRDQSWTEDDDVTILSAMGASVMTAVKRKKKLVLLRDKRDLSAKKSSKRTSKSSSKDKQKNSSCSSSKSALENHITKKSGTSSTCDKGTESVKNSSRKSRSDRSIKSTKESSSSSSKSRKPSHEESGNRDHRRSSSSSRKPSKVSSSRPDSSTSLSTSQKSDRDNSKSHSLSLAGTPPTSFSSTTSSTLDETSPLAAVIIRQRKTKTTDAKLGNTGSSNGGSLSKKTTSEPSASGAEGKSSDPPGRRAARSKSSHAEDKTLRSMRNQAKVPASINVKK